MSVGQRLATAREHAALSVEQVSDRTRIRRTLIVAIEQDDFSRCGGDFYARGHVKAIATAVGIDPTPLLAVLDAEEARVPKANSASAMFEAERVSRRERRSPNWSALMAAALVTVLATAGWQIVRSSIETRSAQTVASGSSPTTQPTTAGPSAPQPSTVPGPAVAPTTPAVSPGAVPPGVVATAPAPGVVPPGVVAAPPRTSVELAVAAATAASWISVKDSTDTTVFAGTIPLGQVRTYRDPQRLRVVMGNAGGLSLTVNGIPVGSPGAPGQVVRREFGLADPARS